MKLFIRNIEGSINEMQLEGLFAQFGPVLSAKIIYDKITWESKGYGFLEMKNKADAEKAMAALNGKEIRGKEAEEALDRARITVNKNAIPFDTNKPLNPSGIRLGSPAVTTRGFKEEEMREVGKLIATVLTNIGNEDVIASVRRKVEALTARFPLYSWKREPARA